MSGAVELTAGVNVSFCMSPWYAGLTVDHLFPDCNARQRGEGELRRVGWWDVGGDTIDPHQSDVCGLCLHRHNVREHAARKKVSPAEKRFWPRVEKTDGCWLWTGRLNKRGYGLFWDGERNALAHRWSYTQAKGAIPEGLFVLHSCDVRHCVNPDHLRTGTHQDNVADMMERRRAFNGRTAMTQCLNGHPHDEVNTRIDPKGHRICRKCHATRQRRIRSRRAARGDVQ